MARIDKNRPAILPGLGTLIFSLLVLINIFRLPLGEADDEPDYMHFAQFILETGHPPRTPEEREAAGARGGFAPLYYQMLAQIIAPINLDPLPALRRVSDRPQRYIPEDGLGRGRMLHTLEEQPPFVGIVLAWYVARALSLLLGLGIILVTYLWAKEMFFHAPDRAELALAVALFAAFLPRFVINSATLSDDNLTTLCMILFLFLLLRIARYPEGAGLYFGAGAVMGLATLAKYHGILLGLHAALLFAYLFIRKRLALATLMRRALWFALGFLLIGGPWLGFIVYHFNRIADYGLLPGLAAALGEPLLVGRLNQGLVRQSGPAEAVLGFSEWLVLLFKSFWFEYGFMTLFGQPQFYWVVGLALALALVGWLFYIGRRGLKGFPLSFGVVLAAFHLGLFGLILLGRYNVAPTVATPQGRHLFPALPVIGAIFFLGLGQLFGRRSITILAALYALFGLTANLLFVEQVVRPAYRYLPVAGDAARFDMAHPFQAPVNDSFTLLGYDAPDQAEPGQALPLTLYWQATAEMETDYWLKICLTNPAGDAVSCHHSYLGGATYPTRSWETGDVIAGSLHLPLAACLGGGPHHLNLSIVPLNPAARQITPLPEPPLTLQLPNITNLGQGLDHAAGSEIWYQGERLITGPHPRRSATPPLPLNNGRGGRGVRASNPLSLRDVVTVLTYDSPPPTHLRNEADPASPWPAAAEPTQVTCPGGQQAWLTPFAVDYGVQPGRYRLDLPGADAEPALAVTARPRPLAPDQGFSERVAGRLSLQVAPMEQTAFYPGQELRVRVTWQAERLMAAPYLVSIRLLDKDFTPGGEKDVPLGGRYPNVLWAPGEVVDETYGVIVNRDAPPGRYQLEFSLIEILTGESFRFLPFESSDGESEDHLYPFAIRILDPAHDQGAPAQVTDFTLGANITLTGYTAQISGDNALDLALYWQTEAAPDDDYTVFTQLIGPDGQVWAQQDNQPQAGRYPTHFWQPGDRVIDRYRLHLNPNAPPGPYHLLVGMYHLQTGQRLPVTGTAGLPVPNGAVLLGAFSYQEGGGLTVR